MMFTPKSIQLYLVSFVIFIIAGIPKAFTKEYVFIGVPSISKIKRIVSLLDDKEKDRVSFVVPEYCKDDMEEALKVLPGNIHYISYIPGITEEQMDAEIDILDRKFHDVKLAYDKIHNKLPKVDGILAACEFSMYSAAKLRTKYGIPGLQEAQGLYFRDKSKMKERLGDQQFIGRPIKLNIPLFAKLDKDMTFDHIKSQMRSAGIGYPLILKPRGSAGAIGIYLAKNDKELNNILPKINKEIPYEINEFIDAQVIHSNGIVKEGKIVLISSYEYGRTPLEQGCYGVASQTIFELKGPEIDKKLFDISSEVIYRLGMENGVYHMELFKDKDGKITFLEIAARAPGDESTPLIEVATGVNLFDMCFAISMNSPSWKKKISKDYVKKIKYHGLYLTAFGQNQSVEVTKVDTSQIKGITIEKQVLPSLGQVIKADNATYKNFGYFIFSTNTAEELTLAYQNVRDNYIIEFKPTEELATPKT